MSLETGTYINSLVATNPVGAVDPKSQGDDHIRLIKSTVKATFPNLTGAMTADQTELNYLDGATGLTGTGNTVRSDAPTFTGVLTAQSIVCTGIAGSGGSLTALNASNLASGTVPDARFPATLPAASGVNLTALNASNLASGTVPDARFPATLPAASGVNLTALNASNLASGSVADARLSANAALYNATTITVNWRPTTPNTNADEVGFKGAPLNSQSGDYTCVLTDAGKTIMETGTSKTVTIPANASVAYPLGTVLAFVANSSNAVTIAITSDTLYLAGTGFGTTGNRTLAAGGMAAALKIQSGAWLISGTGLS